MTNIHSEATLGAVFIGLPVWQHNSWPKCWFGKQSALQLADYSAQLNSIEGNTTFYHLPTAESVERWHQVTPDTFRFTFKFHADISHKQRLRHCDDLVSAQLHRLERLQHKLGQLMLQLPASFGPEDLPLLQRFLQQLPPDFSYGVEVRHPAFFAKGEAEKALNQYLIAQRVNRIIMDTRSLFSGPSDTALTAEVRTKKPRVPVNVIATAQQPIVRFVGNNDPLDNERCLQPWVHKCHQWRQQHKTCYFFFHRPDNQHAPWLAQQFIDLYNQQYPDTPLASLKFAPPPAQQNSLF
ncbi:DUF72 domain-containing protein [Alteromonas gilva]|uniref:DUF72 domain-containing protein n=1 Tax=Alteromonas gilva TaxID=2987522 RepID=A0ABT5L6T0_9ALTE|nr:DUF72 domain-containing protein [Alteromonas gilva]MDC8831532.1 DUF72 domain-containing protein [Alteromonas gilva]